MDAKRFAVATVVGGIALYVVAYLIFAKAMAAFYAADAGSATGVSRDGDIIWAVMLGNFAYAALITFAMRRAVGSIGEGVKIGAIVGFLIWCTTDFIFYGSTNIANLTRTVFKPLLRSCTEG